MKKPRKRTYAGDGYVLRVSQPCWRADKVAMEVETRVGFCEISLSAYQAELLAKALQEMAAHIREGDEG